MVEANAVIRCVDLPDPLAALDRARELADVLRFQSELPPWGGSWATSGCAGMPKPAKGDALGDVRVAGTPPMLVIGTTGDPATPYSGAVAMLGRIAGAGLLTFESTEHTAFGTARSTCIDDAVTAYLVDGAMPAPDTRCRLTRFDGFGVVQRAYAVLRNARTSQCGEGAGGVDGDAGAADEHLADDPAGVPLEVEADRHALADVAGARLLHRVEAQRRTPRARSSSGRSASRTTSAHSPSARTSSSRLRARTAGSPRGSGTSSSCTTTTPVAGQHELGAIASPASAPTTSSPSR